MKTQKGFKLVSILKASIFTMLAAFAMNASAGVYVGSHYEPYVTYVCGHCVNGCWVNGKYVVAMDYTTMYSSSLCVCGGCG